MSDVPSRQQIASAYVVLYGSYGDVTRFANEQGICRQWVYRLARQFRNQWHQHQQLRQHFRQQLTQLQQEREQLQELLQRSVLLDETTQAEFATVGQARGVSLPDCHELLEVLIPGRAPSVATLGRRTQEAGQKAGQVLAVFDEFGNERVREVAADEIYVKDPVLMMVEPESLCWISGHKSDDVSGATWQKEFESLPNLELVIRDGGRGLAKGVELVNSFRSEEPNSLLADQGDHYHALRHGGIGLRRAEQQASKALAKAEKAELVVQERKRQGRSRAGYASQAKRAWEQAEEAMDAWSDREHLWQRTKEALRLFSPEGKLNSREQADAVLAETLPELPDADFAKVKSQLQKPEMLAYLDRVEDQLKALPFAEEVKQAAIRQEGLRRQPKLLAAMTPESASCRGVLLVCAVILSRAGEVGQQAVAAVREVLSGAYRASSVVEGVNSVLRMHQSRHRKLSQGLLDLKRLYWNSHEFRTGPRRKTTPYQRLGVPWPEGLRWWEVLELTPEQLRDKLSTAINVA
jgi:hypothetical protein